MFVVSIKVSLFWCEIKQRGRYNVIEFQLVNKLHFSNYLYSIYL
ncbi:hypothetical protein MADA3029_1210031 [Vibrio nigripulchritudo MADA3029]|nr:hypothetical protein VIBNIMADA3020_1080030 [Vibrio nigripulchritudo MADA3020]CCN57947.1 hypothetical protein MADA3029_1210031 [Vibrio nigripulchritudo MADA3029]